MSEKAATVLLIDFHAVDDRTVRDAIRTSVGMNAKENGYPLDIVDGVVDDICQSDDVEPYADRECTSISDAESKVINDRVLFHMLARHS